MDVWVNFTNATKWQAEGIFKCFFPSRASKEKAESDAAAAAASTEKGITNTNSATKNVPGIKRKVSSHAVPVLEEEEINMLAKRFAEQIPEDEMSVRTHHSSLALVCALRSIVLRFTFSFFCFCMCGAILGCELARISSQEQDSSA